ncbi:MAG TPA: type II toxin-antitoxin system RelE/ParE family toxin [Chryseosolibacter sp.]|nr:type II toxin-antitoxin system RelE/ParE family toxin [Chryseosolibacter sp.]
MTITLTKRAVNTLQSIRAHIHNTWGEKAAVVFEEKTFHFFDLLEEFPEIGTVEMPDKQIRGFQLTKQTKVFYRVKGFKIIILTFFDVRQSPRKIPR